MIILTRVIINNRAAVIIRLGKLSTLIAEDKAVMIIYMSFVSHAITLVRPPSYVCLVSAHA